MPLKLVIANLKAELDTTETKTWLKGFTSLLKQTQLKNKQIIIAPPFIYLDMFKQQKEEYSLNIALGSQSLSEFAQGKYTGEITAAMLKDFVEYVIIGHSEERRINQETKQDIQKKIDLANKYKVKVILCLERKEKYTGEIFALAYEPTAAIGTGKAESATKSYSQMQIFKQNIKAQHYLYGGSVNNDNVQEFIQAGFTGVLVGKQSLEPKKLIEIVRNI